MSSSVGNVFCDGWDTPPLPMSLNWKDGLRAKLAGNVKQFSYGLHTLTLPTSEYAILAAGCASGFFIFITHALLLFLWSPLSSTITPVLYSELKPYLFRKSFLPLTPPPTILIVWILHVLFRCIVHIGFIVLACVTSAVNFDFIS